MRVCRLGPRPPNSPRRQVGPLRPPGLPAGLRPRFPQGSTSQPSTTAACQSPRTVRTRGRGAPSGRKHPTGWTGRGSGLPGAVGHLPTGWRLGVGAAPGSRPAGPGAQRWMGAWCRSPGAGPRSARAPGLARGRGLAGRGRGLEGRFRDSSPLRRDSRPSARRTSHLGPMTKGPDPSRPGSRHTTIEEPEAALLLSPPPLQQELPGCTETPAHLSFPQHRARRDGT
uniref:Bcl-2-binding component 3-like n=1 Tax=Castor canadensis TaxID=51338 RepID=A0A8B7VF23_CASCN|nr:bcl-2-binding component 3-like [Castor canadensis]